jgi:NAD(P)-dependent dehydrogenase (short-subunit alcohol dehydrogenase family)
MFTKKRIVVISGARPGGIGAATAEALALGEGDIVFICDREPALGAEVVDDLLRRGGDVALLEADLTDEADAARVVREVELRYRRLDVLVANAGDARDPRHDTIAHLSLGELVSLFSANVGTAFVLAKHALPLMLAQGSGSMIFLGSNNGSIGAMGQLGYGIAKRALQGLVRILCAQYGPAGIRFNLVEAGIVETNSRNWQQRRAIDPHWADKEALMNPQGRIGQPEDVAKVIAFLAGDGASFINGECIVVDGGLRASGIMVPGWDPNGDFRESYVTVISQLVNGHRPGVGRPAPLGISEVA